MSGKILGRAVGKKSCNFSKILISISNHCLSPLNLYSVKIFHRTAAFFFLKEFLQSGTAHGKMLANLVRIELFTDTKLHILNDFFNSLRFCIRQFDWSGKWKMSFSFWWSGIKLKVNSFERNLKTVQDRAEPSVVSQMVHWV